MASRYGNTDYNPSSNSSGSSSNEYKDRVGLKLDKYATIEFTLDRVGLYEDSTGQKMILNMDDVEVIDGIVMDRDDGKVKIFGWDQWFDRNPETMELVPIEGDEIDRELIPERHSEQFGDNQFRYSLRETVLEADGDDSVEIEDAEFWIGNSTKARTLAKVLSTKGHGMVADKDDDFNWLSVDARNSQFPMREDLEDRRLQLWFQRESFTPDDSDEEVTYTDAVVLDGKTEAGITIDNNGGGTGNRSESGNSVDSTHSDDSDTQERPNGRFPSGVEELIGVFARSGQTNRERVGRMIDAELDDGQTVDMDEVMDKIEARMD